MSQKEFNNIFHISYVEYTINNWKCCFRKEKMKTLFLVTKYYAYAETADSIGLQHIKQALEHVNILDQEAWEILHLVLFKETPLTIQDECIEESQYLISLLPKIEKEPIIQFDAEVKELLKKLKEKGILLRSSEISVIDGIDIYKEQVELLYNIQKSADMLTYTVDVFQGYLTNFLLQAKQAKNDLYSICLNKNTRYHKIEKKKLEEFNSKISYLLTVANSLFIDNIIEVLSILERTSAFIQIERYLDRFYVLIDQLVQQSEFKGENKGMDLIKAAKAMKKTLAEKIYGQEKAISVVSDSIKNNILASEKAPKATYFF